MSRTQAFLTSYGVVAVVHLLSIVLELSALATATKVLLMPLLAAYLVSISPQPFSRLVRVALGALAFSLVGDILLDVAGRADSDAWFLAGVGAFFAAQVLYIVAFTPLVRSGDAGRPPFWALVYVLYGALLTGWLAPALGGLLLPVAVYAVAISTMGIVAAGVNRYTALGALLFVLSDSMIAVGRFSDVWTLEVGSQRILIMTTYLLAQVLLVVGVGRADDAERERARVAPAAEG